MDRRGFLKAGLGVSASAAVPGLVRPAGSRASTVSDAAGWRAFEVTTRVEVVNPAGVTRVWLPLPLATDTGYQKGLGNRWTGNTAAARVLREEKYGAGLLYAEWAETEKTPFVELTSRVATRDRAVGLKEPGSPVREDRSVLAKYLEPTRLLPTDGVVRQTAREITAGRRTDLARARAIYEWIVDNTFRDPKVRGCGLGDIRGMLETRNLGGKCADLNALFVGLARAAGVPARDVYGVRVADSAEYRSLGKAGEITRAQHCRAEFYLPSHGWVPVDPADVRKVVLEERPGLTLGDPLAQRVRARLFGAWEMNWIAFNYAHDVALPHSAGEPVPFLMYPQAETAAGRRDSLEPEAFRYRITARELRA